MAITIQVLKRGDDDVLKNVAEDVFDNPIDSVLVREFLEDHRHHIVVAVEDGGCVVGFASGVDYIHPDKPLELWVNEVGVASTHRRKGLGSAVLRALLEVGRAKGCRSAWVLTDRSNPAAMALYLSVGGVEGVGGAGPTMPIVGYSFAMT